MLDLDDINLPDEGDAAPRLRSLQTGLARYYEVTDGFEAAMDLNRLITLIEEARENLEEIEELTRRITGLPTSKTRFPWHLVSSRAKHSLRLAIKGVWSREYFDGLNWPLSCEDLVQLGSRHCIRYADNFGVKSAGEIADLLDKLGFPDWMDSGDRNVSIP
jgi:hypothetical protein